MKGDSKINWKELKSKYLYGPIESVSEFLSKEGIKITGFVTRKTKGWRTEREEIEMAISNKAKDKLIEMLSDEEVEIRKRQAAIAKHLQEIALKALSQYEPKNCAEAVRMLQIGMREEREALGLNNDKKPNEYREPSYMKTRFAKALTEMSTEELKKVLDELGKNNELN